MKKYKLLLNDRHFQLTIKKHHWSKQISLSVKRNGQILVTIPQRLPYASGLYFARQKQQWLEQRLPMQLIAKKNPTKRQREYARTLVEQKLTYWNARFGFSYNKVSIRNQSTRWGSCSAHNNLNFNWRIVELPEELQDYLIIHELAHLKEHNHSPRFWLLVEQVLPEYKMLRKQLKNLQL